MEPELNPLRAEEPTAEAVACYLAQHPGFLTSHPGLMARLTPPSEHRDSRTTGIVDFQHFMVRQLQRDLSSERQLNGEILAHARGSLSLLTRVHASVLALLEAQSFEEMIAIVTGDLAVYLDLDIAMLMIESRGAEMHGAIRLVPRGSIDKWMAGKPVRITRGVEGDPAIYGEGAGLVKSEVLLRLEISRHAPTGMLALGSRQDTGFDEGQSTELLGFLARVVERCARAWLDLPE